MTKKLLGVFTAIVAALAVVGVAWAGTDAGTSTSITAASSTSATVDDTTTDSVDDSTSSTGATTFDSSTSTSVDDHRDDRDDDRDDDDATTSTSIAATTSTSAAETTSTSLDDDDDGTTSTTIDEDDRVVVPDGITTHTIPGVGSVTIEASGGQLFLVSVSAPGWNVETEKLEHDRIELEFTNELDAEAEFEARINDGRIEVRIEVDSD